MHIIFIIKFNYYLIFFVVYFMISRE